jgi:hypothetical protein
MNNLILHILKEVASGHITIDGDIFNIGFNTIIYDNDKVVLNTTQNENLPTLIIKNMELFNKKVNEYITTVLSKRTKFPTVISDKEYNQLKFVISYLFANATSIDFSNPISFIDRNISYLLDTTFDNLKNGIQSEPLSSLYDSSVQVKLNEQSLFIETPYKLDISVVKRVNNNLLTYDLPSVSFGITTDSNGVKNCYIYYLQNPKKKMSEKTDEQIKYEKKIARELYKINAGVFENESDEYKAYKNQQSDYYPENISDVSPSAVLSASIMMGILASYDIRNIKIVDFLPVRWHAKDQSISTMITTNKDLTSEEREELRDKQKLIQENITDKFLRTFRRLEYHCSGITVDAFPKDVDDCMHITLNNSNNEINNPMLKQAYDSVININYQNSRNK